MVDNSDNDAASGRNLLLSALFLQQVPNGQRYPRRHCNVLCP